MNCKRDYRRVRRAASRRALKTYRSHRPRRCAAHTTSSCAIVRDGRGAMPRYDLRRKPRPVHCRRARRRHLCDPPRCFCSPIARVLHSAVRPPFAAARHRTPDARATTHRASASIAADWRPRLESDWGLVVPMQAAVGTAAFASVSLFGLAAVPTPAALPSTIAPASAPAEWMPRVAAALAAAPTYRPTDPV